MRALLYLLGPVCVIGCSYDFDSYLPTGQPLPGDTGVVSDAVTDAATDAATDGEITCSEPGAQRFEGHCYFPLTSTSTFDRAQSNCAAAGAHLATITSAAEEAFVEAMRPGRERWIGLRRADSADPRSPSSFAWITGESGSFAKWATGEPNGSGACARLRGSNDWADQSCSTANEAICERE